MARSGLFPDITRVSQAVVKVLAGRELGIGPFAAMSDIHIIEGKPVIGARILAALVRQSAVYDYEIVEWTNERCAIDFFRHGQKLEPTLTFTEENAHRAELDQPTRAGKSSNHMKFPRNNFATGLVAREVHRLAALGASASRLATSVRSLRRKPSSLAASRLMRAMGR